MPEFVNGDRLEGYLQIRKEVVDAGTTPSDLARRDLDQKLRFLPGFVEGKEEKFSGRLKRRYCLLRIHQDGKTDDRPYLLSADR